MMHVRAIPHMFVMGIHHNQPHSSYFTLQCHATLSHKATVSTMYASANTHTFTMLHAGKGTQRGWVSAIQALPGTDLAYLCKRAADLET